METLLYQRIKLLCSERNITINKLESELRFAPSTIQKWKTVNSPSINKVLEVANYFNVSTDFLLGRTNIRGSADDILLLCRHFAHTFPVCLRNHLSIRHLHTESQSPSMSAPGHCPGTDTDTPLHCKPE